MPLSNTVSTTFCFPLHLQHFISSSQILPYPGHSRRPERKKAQAEQESMYNNNILTFIAKPTMRLVTLN